jgi:hypothetical protein
VFVRDKGTSPLTVTHTDESSRAHPPNTIGSAASKIAVSFAASLTSMPRLIGMFRDATFYEYFIIDVFASEAFAGNPAGAALDAPRPSHSQMQPIAREPPCQL